MVMPFLPFFLPIYHFKTKLLDYPRVLCNASQSTLVNLRCNLDFENNISSRWLQNPKSKVTNYQYYKNLKINWDWIRKRTGEVSRLRREIFVFLSNNIITTTNGYFRLRKNLLKISVQKIVVDFPWIEITSIVILCFFLPLLLWSSY